MTNQVKTVEVSAGTIEYEDTGGSGPVVVLLHGFLMDSSLWGAVVADLARDHRCVVPILPLGAHRRPVRPDADLSLPGIARLVDEFLGRLELRDVVLVGNDTGGAVVQLVMGNGGERLASAVLVSCEAFDNLPPGLTGRALGLTGKLPPRLFGGFMQQLRARPMRRLPITFGWLTKRGDAVTRGWLEPVWHNRDIRRDAVRAIRAVMSDRQLLLEAAKNLAQFTRPALVVWASEDRVMPPEHGRRLAEVLPQATLVEVDDSYTLIPLDQPAEFASIVRGFTHV
jgi:pimeloyl-ACP methyl ester carboxylesterase